MCSGAVPRSTARGWLGAAPTVVVSLEGADLSEPELRQEILKLRRRVEKLAALLRLAMALLHTSGFRLSHPTRLGRIHLRERWQTESLGMKCGRSFDGNIHFSAGASRRGVHCGHDESHVQLQDWPLRIGKHDDRDRAAGQILLVADVLVRGDQHFKAGAFGSGEQVAIVESVPTLRFRLPDCVT